MDKLVQTAILYFCSGDKCFHFSTGTPTILREILCCLFPYLQTHSMLPQITALPVYSKIHISIISLLFDSRSLQPESLTTNFLKHNKKYQL